MIEIILLEPEHEGNVGAVARAMANFGFSKLVVVNPKCDLENDEFSKRAKHSKGKVSVSVRKKLPKYDLLVGTTAKINTDYNIKRSPILSDVLAGKIKGVRGRIGVLFGREGIGLTNNEIKKCDFIVTINSSKEYSTLNLSHAVAIILYELHKGMKGKKIADKIELAGNAEKKQVQKMVNGVKRQLGGKKETQKKLWKNVFNKAMLSKREAFGIMGLLRKIKNNLSK